MHYVTAEYIAYYFIAINFITFTAFGIDKAQAEKGTRRTSEATLLKMAFLGGTPAAYAARALFRHKTRKTSFRLKMVAVSIFNVAWLLVWLWYRGSIA